LAEENAQPKASSLSPGPVVAPAVAPAPPTAAQDAAAPLSPRLDDGFLPPPDYFAAPLRAFLEAKRRDGEQVTIEVGKVTFTGRIFRLSLEEGWIALEHIDGRRRAFIIMEGGKIKTQDGLETPLPAAGHK